MRHPSAVGGKVIVPDQPITGPAGNRYIRSLVRTQDEWNQKDWPYEWIYPPRNSIRVFAAGTIAAPAAATQTQVLAYTVPTGFRFIMKALVAIYNGTGFVPGSGDITWVWDVNIQIGVSTMVGYPVQGFQSLTIPIGSLAAPWPLERPEELDENNVVRSKITTTSNISSGTFSSIVVGWLLPELGKES